MTKSEKIFYDFVLNYSIFSILNRSFPGSHRNPIQHPSEATLENHPIHSPEKVIKDSEEYRPWKSQYSNRNRQRPKSIENCLTSISGRKSYTDSTNDTDIIINRRWQEIVQRQQYKTSHKIPRYSGFGALL